MKKGSDIREPAHEMNAPFEAKLFDETFKMRAITFIRRGVVTDDQKINVCELSCDNSSRAHQIFLAFVLTQLSGDSYKKARACWKAATICLTIKPAPNALESFHVNSI